MVRPRLRPQEARILKSLLEYGGWLTTTQVAKRARISWNTAEKYLRIFHRKGWIALKRRGNRYLWRAYRY